MKFLSVSESIRTNPLEISINIFWEIFHIFLFLHVPENFAQRLIPYGFADRITYIGHLDRSGLKLDHLLKDLTQISKLFNLIWAPCWGTRQTKNMRLILKMDSKSCSASLVNFEASFYSCRDDLVNTNIIWRCPRVLYTRNVTFRVFWLIKCGQSHIIFVFKLSEPDAVSEKGNINISFKNWQ